MILNGKDTKCFVFKKIIINFARYSDLKKNVKTINLKPNVMTKEEIVKQVKDIIVDKLGVEESAVTESASFTNDLGADSLDRVELVMALEDEFEVEILDSDAEKFAKVADVVAFIEAKKA